MWKMHITVLKKIHLKTLKVFPVVRKSSHKHHTPPSEGLQTPTSLSNMLHIPPHHQNETLEARGAWKGLA